MSKRVYVKNLPFEATEEQVQEFFAAGGKNVVKVDLIMNRETGRPRGFGFVEYENEQDAQGAIESLNGKDFGGRPLVVDLAREMTPRTGGQSRGGFDSGRSRFGSGGGSGSRGGRGNDRGGRSNRW